MATALLALSYGLVACLWGLALHRAAGARLAAGAPDLVPLQPGPLRPGQRLELRRRGSSWPGARVARRTTLAVMALTQVCRSGWRCWPGCVLLAEQARLGRPALLGAVVVAARAGLAALFRHRLLGLARERLPGSTPPA